MDESKNFQQQNFNLRNFLDILLNKLWLIISITVLVGITSFLISKFVITPKYRSSAFINLTEPVIKAELDESIKISPVLPDSRALPDLAEAESILNQVMDSIDISERYQEEVEMEAYLQGNSQLLLQVTLSDPVLAEKIANHWAEVMVNNLNELYSIGQVRYEEFNSEVDNAQESWYQAQENLENFLSDSEVEVLKIQLSQAKTNLSRTITIIESNEKLIQDTEVQISRLEYMNSEAKLPLGDALSLIALQQRITGNISGAEFQIEGEDLFGPEFTVLDAGNILKNLVVVVENQNETLGSKKITIEKEITRLTLELEKEQHLLERLTQKRDLAKDSYQALASQLEEMRIMGSQNVKTIKIGASAVAPENPYKPSLLINSALGIIGGLIISIACVLVAWWWKQGT